MSMNLFARLTKVDEEKRLVYGRATEEVVDRAGEIFDYETSKPYFEKWSGDISKATDGKSLGNVRAMHGNVAAGKLVTIDFNDEEKAIDICAKIVDDAEWNKVLEGVYTGFSIGGSYQKTWTDTVAKARRYTADPCEISVVDLPCVPTASFFDIQKADGTVMHKVFKAAETPAVAAVDELAKLLDSGEVKPEDILAMIKAAKDPVAPVAADPAADPVPTPEPVVKVIEPVLTKAGKKVVLSTDNLVKAGRLAMTKNMDRVASFAWLLSSVQCLQQGSAAEEAREGDDSTMPAELLAWLKQGGDLLASMVAEEVAEMVDGEGIVQVVDVYYSEWAAAVDGLIKSAEGQENRKEFFEKAGARHSKTDKERLQTAHNLLADMGADCPAEDDAEKAVHVAAMQKLSTVEATVTMLTTDMTKMTDDLTKVKADLTSANAALVKVAEERDELTKASDALKIVNTELEKSKAELTEKVEKLSAQPAYAGFRMAVAKSHDLGLETPVVDEVEPIMKSDGTVDEIATAIKKARRAGGVPVQRG